MSPAEERRAWAYGLISRAATPPPAYGSLEWLALPDGPEKVAAVVLAAEKCLIDWEAAKAAEDAAWLAARDQHKAAWTGRGFRPDRTIVADIDEEFRAWVGEAS